MADLAVVFATLDPTQGLGGITAFLVENGTPGFSVGRDIDKMGLRTAPMSELILQDCHVPEQNRLGPEGAGASVFNSSMEWERSCILASHVGAMQRQLESSATAMRGEQDRLSMIEKQLDAMQQNADDAATLKGTPG